MPLRCTRLCGNISPLVQSLLDLPMKWCQAHSYWLRCMSCLQISILSNEGVHWWMESMLFLSLTNTTSCKKQRVSWMQLSHRTERTVRHQLSQHQQCTMTLTISSSLLYLATAFLFSAAVFVFILPCCFEGRIHPKSSRVYLEKSFFFCSIRFGYPVGLGIWFHFSVILSSPCGITHSIATGILPLK